jgi:hypothetical protein
LAPPAQTDRTIAINLEIYATDPEVISLIRGYWAMHDEGDFLAKVDALPVGGGWLVGMLWRQKMNSDAHRSGTCFCKLPIKSVF